MATIIDATAAANQSGNSVAALVGAGSDTFKRGGNFSLAALCAVAFLLGGTAVSHAQSGYIADRPTIDCSKARNAVALVLCSGPRAAQADWELSAAYWSYYFTLDAAARERMAADQRAWRQSLEPICALPRLMTREEQAGQQMAQAFGRMFLGPGMVIPGPAPITQAHVDCLLNAYHARAAALRSKLTGDALAEARLGPEQRADLQHALAAKGFLRSDQIGPGTGDGEFGPITRTAIKQFQQSTGAAPTGFLSADQRTALLERPEERAAREARIAAETARREAEEKARQDALTAKAAAEAKAKAEAEIAAAREAERIAAAEKVRQDALIAKAAAEAKAKAEAEIAAAREAERIAEAAKAKKEAEEKAERERLEREAEAARQWRLKIDEAEKQGSAIR